MEDEREKTEGPPGCGEEDREPTLFFVLAVLLALEAAGVAVAWYVGRFLWMRATA